MPDSAGYEIIGPVRTLRRELAEWDAASQAWGPPEHLTESTFRRDGCIQESQFHNPDGSIVHWAWLYDADGRLVEKQSWANDGPKARTRHFYDSSGRALRTVESSADGIDRESERYHYDSTGRKTKVEFLPLPAHGVDMSYAVDGSEQSYSVPGASTSTTTYDEHDRPIEVQFHDATHMLIHTITFTRDREGHVLAEEGRFAGVTFETQMAEKLKVASDEDRAKLTTLMAAAFPDQTITRTTYEYDQQGRRMTVTRGMGAMGGERTTFVYDDHDNVVEETTETRRQLVSLDDDGSALTKEEPTLGSRSRFEYEYDAKGNWTQRVVLAWLDADKDFRRSSIERRVITYY